MSRRGRVFRPAVFGFKLRMKFRIAFRDSGFHLCFPGRSPGIKFAGELTCLAQLSRVDSFCSYVLAPPPPKQKQKKTKNHDGAVGSVQSRSFAARPKSLGPRNSEGPTSRIPSRSPGAYTGFGGFRVQGLEGLSLKNQRPHPHPT